MLPYGLSNVPAGKPASRPVNRPAVAWPGSDKHQQSISGADGVRIDELLERLAALPQREDYVNIYRDDGPPGGAVRRRNLQLALEQGRKRGPDLLLIGEAPGYNGCRRSGVPFTSEPLLLAGIPALQQFGSERGFVRAVDDGPPPAEITATIVYTALAAHGCYAVGWNAAPLHPCRAGNPRSNRTPRVGELAEGIPLLAAFLALFPAVPVAAMGRLAAQQLQRLGVAHTPLRHPAQGGATIFRRQLEQLCPTSR
jgi:uracil-DNA glycosylase